MSRRYFYWILHMCKIIFISMCVLLVVDHLFALLTLFRAWRTVTNIAFGLYAHRSRLLASPVYLKHLAWRNWHFEIHKLYRRKTFSVPRQVQSHSITMASVPQLINIGNARNTHQHFLPNRLVMGCYFSARKDTIDHIENWNRLQ